MECSLLQLNRKETILVTHSNISLVHEIYVDLASL